MYNSIILVNTVAVRLYVKHTGHETHDKIDTFARTSLVSAITCSIENEWIAKTIGRCYNM